MSDLTEFVHSITDMTEWQRRLLAEVASVQDQGGAAFQHGRWRMTTSGKREGKLLASALAVAEALESGEHVHIAEPGSTTCVNGTCDTSGAS